MTVVLALLLANAVLGAWDTLWYHEYRTALPRHLHSTRTELGLHAARDGVYVVLYGTLALVMPSGWLVVPLGALVITEIAITLLDFVVEDRDRPAIGGIAPGERILHSAMAIVYGAMLAYLVPLAIEAWNGPTGLVRHDAPAWMSICAGAAAIGIAGSGVRDALAASRPPRHHRDRRPSCPREGRSAASIDSSHQRSIVTPSSATTSASSSSGLRAPGSA